MRRINLSRLIALCAISILAACGNDDVFNGASIVDEGASDQVASLVLLASSTALRADAVNVEDGVSLTVVAKDADSNVVPGAAVRFMTTDSAEIIVANPAATDENGRVDAVLTTGGDSSLRTITVTVSSGDLTDSVEIDVVGVQSALSSLVLLAGAPTLSSDAAGVTAGITLTAIAKDANNNVLPGIQVVFSTADSAEINVSNPALTDANGRAEAVLTTGGDQTNRTITVTATSEKLSNAVSVDVVGTQIDISGPTGTQFGVPTEFVISLNDAAGNGIPGRVIELSTEPENTLSASSLESDEFGLVVVEFEGAVQNSSLTASALGLTSSAPIAVSPDNFVIGLRSPGETAFSPVGVADVPELIVGQQYEVVASWQRSNQTVDDGRVIQFGATRGDLNRASALTQSGLATTLVESSEAGFSILTAFSDELSKPSARISAEFVATEPAKIVVQASPANVPRNQSSEIVAIVRDANNNLVKNATVDFSLSDQTTGTLSAPTAVTNSQGLAKVTYTASSQASATEGVQVFGQVRGTDVVHSAAITVGGTAVDIALGTGSEIILKDESTYQLPFTIIVTDAAGNPVPDADVSLTLLATTYYEGTRSNKVPCSNEDLNSNDIFEPQIDNDQNGNGTLEPGRRASLPATVDLDEFGSGQFFVTYAKTDGSFIGIEITATAKVAGTETTEKRSFDLKIAEVDEDNLPDRSPFGLDLNCETFDPPNL